jgi:hypothetical protein
LRWTRQRQARKYVRRVVFRERLLRDGAPNASVTAVIPANYTLSYQLRVGFSQRL